MQKSDLPTSHRTPKQGGGGGRAEAATLGPPDEPQGSKPWQGPSGNGGKSAATSRTGPLGRKRRRRQKGSIGGHLKNTEMSQMYKSTSVCLFLY